MIMNFIYQNEWENKYSNMSNSWKNLNLPLFFSSQIEFFQLHFSKYLIGCDVACCQRKLLTYCSGSSNRGEQHPCWQGDFKGEQRSPLSGVFRGDRVPLWLEESKETCGFVAHDFPPESLVCYTFVEQMAAGIVAHPGKFGYSCGVLAGKVAPCGAA